MAESIISLKDVNKTYIMGTVEVPALNGIDLDIKPGDFIAILGVSGSGKSTMMNLVGCLDYPTKGAIFLYGQDIFTLSESDLASIRGKKIGFIFQKFNLISTLDAIGNVALALDFQGVEKKEATERARTLLEFVGLGHRLNHKPNELSGGEQQRVAIARSLANDPDIILADEPTGNLDTKTGKMIMDLLVKLNKEGKTVIMVTHDLNLAKSAKRVIQLRDGEIMGGKK